MKAFSLLSPLTRDLLQLWALLLCLIAIICIVYAFRQKKYPYISAPLICLFISYFVFQIMTEISLGQSSGSVNSFCFNCGGIPWLLYALLMTLLALSLAWILYRCIYYKHHNIHTDSIRLCADAMPCGICYWKDGGRVIFANKCMMELCYLLTGYPLQDGEEFCSAITDPILTIAGKDWSFTSRRLEFKDEFLNELIASDVTELYDKTLSLKAENEEISRYNEELRSYNLNIDETIRQQEILQAKQNIHDEMNRLILSTIASGSDDERSVDDILRLWKNNVLLLCRDAAEGDSGSTGKLEHIADALKIKLIWQGCVPEILTKKQRSLFFSAAQEALANAFKHAKATELKIDFVELTGGIRCDFINNGKLPYGSVHFTGGLSNLRSLAGMQGAEVFVEVSDRFTLSILFSCRDKIRHSADV